MAQQQLKRVLGRGFGIAAIVGLMDLMSAGYGLALAAISLPVFPGLKRKRGL